MKGLKMCEEVMHDIWVQKGFGPRDTVRKRFAFRLGVWYLYVLALVLFTLEDIRDKLSKSK